MQLKTHLIFAAALVLTAAAARAATGRADLKATMAGSNVTGTVLLEDTPNGLKVTASVENAPPGNHGFHLHQFGSCADQGKQAGSHFNPTKAPHGEVTKDGLKKAHAGDLGNLVVRDDGKGTLEAVIPHLALTGGKYDVAGRAFILHEEADDFSQPAGNAGGRIACGPIVLTEGPAGK